MTKLNLLPREPKNIKAYYCIYPDNAKYYPTQEQQEAMELLKKYDKELNKLIFRFKYNLNQIYWQHFKETNPCEIGEINPRTIRNFFKKLKLSILFSVESHVCDNTGTVYRAFDGMVKLLGRRPTKNDFKKFELQSRNKELYIYLPPENYGQIPIDICEGYYWLVNK